MTETWINTVYNIAADTKNDLKKQKQFCLPAKRRAFIPEALSLFKHISVNFAS